MHFGTEIIHSCTPAFNVDQGKNAAMILIFHRDVAIIIVNCVCCSLLRVEV